jgi:hypothetical protein
LNLEFYNIRDCGEKNGTIVSAIPVDGFHFYEEVKKVAVYVPLNVVREP